MKRLSFALSLLSVCAALADVAIVSPRDGATVSLLKDVQRGYLSQDAKTRRAQMSDVAVRAKLAQCGGRPASVTLTWSDTAFDTNVVYAIELKRAGSVGVDRFSVTGAQKAEIVNLESGSAFAWKVQRSSGEKAMAAFRTAEEPRLLFIPGVANCRDLGGKVGLDGKRLCLGRVFRTGAYNGSSKRAGDSFLDSRFVPGSVRITKAGRRELVETCGVKTDIDLRSEAECAAMKGSPLGEGVAWVHVPIRAYGWLDNDKQAMGKILKIFADEKAYPIAFHCAGGRDRAGSLAFVVGGLCGVSEDELVKDWELSAFETSDMGFSPERLDGLVEMLSRYPGETIPKRIEAFALACGVTADEIAKIRANILERK